MIFYMMLEKFEDMSLNECMTKLAADVDKIAADGD